MERFAAHVWRRKRLGNGSKDSSGDEILEEGPQNFRVLDMDWLSNRFRVREILGR